MPELECPLCKGPHTLSQCPGWRSGKRSFFAVLLVCAVVALAASDCWGRT